MTKTRKAEREDEIKDAITKLRYILSPAGGGYTQRAAADKLHTTQSSIYRWLHGDTPYISRLACEAIRNLHAEVLADGPKVQLRQAA